MPTDPPEPSRSARGPAATIFRRVPQQDRGQRGIERILTAAAEVIAEAGVEGASTNAIAARAATSVGSLYQFFPNKDAIVQALIARRTPWVRAAQRRTTAVVQVATVHAVLFHAQELSAAERSPLTDELVRMLVCALEPFEPFERRPADPRAA